MSKTKTRIKKKVITGVTRDQAEQAFAELSTAQASNKKMAAEMETSFTKIREKYQDKFTENETIIEERTEILETWLRENPEVLGKKKSIDMMHGTIGYRLGQHALKNMKGFTWEACKNLVKSFISDDYIRSKEEVDKEKLMADREKIITDVLNYEEGNPVFKIPESDRPKLNTLFAHCGLQVVQDETFYVEPKKELDSVNI